MPVHCGQPDRRALQPDRRGAGLCIRSGCYLNTYSNRVPLPYRDPDSYSYSYSYSHTYTYTYTYSHSYTDSYSNSYTHSYTYSYRHAYTYGYTGHRAVG